MVVEPAFAHKERTGTACLGQAGLGQRQCREDDEKGRDRGKSENPAALVESWQVRRQSDRVGSLCLMGDEGREV